MVATSSHEKHEQKRLVNTNTYCDGNYKVYNNQLRREASVLSDRAVAADMSSGEEYEEEDGYERSSSCCSSSQPIL